jgi:hypothetical protein
MLHSPQLSGAPRVLGPTVDPPENTLAQPIAFTLVSFLRDR